MTTVSQREPKRRRIAPLIDEKLIQTATFQDFVSKVDHQNRFPLAVAKHIDDNYVGGAINV